MKYANVTEGIFLSRPNRFIAHVEVAGRVEICHVKNTGRCKELLIPGVRVILERSQNPARKTAYDLIAVYKGDLLINMDSQAPNKLMHEWLGSGGFFEDLTLIRPECTFGNSRFDFYLEAGERKIFAEVKGVTLERDGVVLFPDAPTQRGVKHLRVLTEALKNGYEAYVFFVIQLSPCRYFTPNRETHPQFAEALREAAAAGVKMQALTCRVTPDTLEVNGKAEVRLTQTEGDNNK